MPQAQQGAGADLLALLEGGAEDDEVERDLVDGQVRAGGHERGDHELGDAVVRSGVAAHDVQAQSVGAPRHEGEQGGDLAALVAGGEEGLDHDALAV